MNEQEFCNELIDADVVRIDIIPASGSTFPIPFGVQNLAQMKGKYPNPSPLPANWNGITFGAALLTVALTNDDDVDAIMKQGVSHKVTPAREVVGIVRTHTTQIPVLRGYQAVRNKEASLQGVDFHVVLTTYDGTQYLAYGCPNSSQFALEEQQGETGTLTAKVIVKSMSGVIRLTD